MSKKTEIMIDLETMGKSSNAPIVSIGAVEFNPATGELGADFETVVNLNSSAYYGKMDASTVQWWLQQSEEARAIFSKETKSVTLRNALQELNDWLAQFGEPKDIYLWGNGSGFDNVILNNAFKAVCIRPNFTHWNDTDVRTLVKLGREILGIDPKYTLKREGTHHSALDDARFQARYVSVIWQYLAARNKPVIDWQSPETTPDIPKGETKTFWLATRYKRKDKWHTAVFDAQYVNKPLEYAEDDSDKECPLDDEHFVDCDGCPIEALGWHSLKEHADFHGYYEPIVFNEERELLGWGEYLAPEFK
ncbi:3'-5' exoribonuclease [Vibrio sp. JC009]|uniref:3'-5' exonuclease n=1 Tax=Vibrio sp. JC009 TaxID=2912314 RepID=UPI0023B1F1F3|nr:3'-5' exonuclease [Vibrio sp. JC009]WED23048.1 3'-5' exoribonuclease [Vibrio sp. JC009]